MNKNLNKICVQLTQNTALWERYKIVSLIQSKVSKSLATI